MRRYMSAILLFSAAWVLGADVEKTGEDFKAFDALAAEIVKAKTLVVYQGLSRGEDGAPKTVKMHSYLFHAEPMKYNPNDLEKLRGLCTQKDLYSAWRGEKKCGGFHPDYCLQWKDGDKVTSVLICFGCHEFKIYGPTESLRCDGGEKVFTSFGQLLRDPSQAKK